MTQENKTPEADRAEREKVLRVFFEDGRLKALPVRQKRRLYVLEFFAGRFETGRDYTEKEMNAGILPVFEDYCTIRRELVDRGFMERDSRGYRRVHGNGWLPEI